MDETNKHYYKTAKKIKKDKYDNLEVWKTST